MSKISNSWQLVKASWAVLLADKELLIFPIISGIAAMFVTITFFVPTVLAGFFDSMIADGFGIFNFIVGFLFYAVLYTVTFFFNTALVAAALIRLDGGDPTVGDGFRIAFKHIRSILGYAVIAATVGTILRTISERSGTVGNIVTGVIGFVWNIATFLVVPVLVVEEVGPVEAIKRSSSLLKQTWGEQITGNISIGLVFGLLMFLVILAGVGLSVLAVVIKAIPLLIMVIVITVMILIGLGLVSSALNGIYTAAVYRYATAGASNDYFDPDIIKSTFKQK